MSNNTSTTQELLWLANFRLTPGYASNPLFTADDIATMWQQVVKHEYEETGAIVNAVMTSSRVLYLEQYGCPPGGCEAITLIGVSDCQYVKDLDSYKQSILKCVKILKIGIGQVNVRVVFNPVEVHQLDEDLQIIE